MPDRSILQTLFAALMARQSAFRKSEQGSILIFSLFILVLIVGISGIAVDTLRYEARRVAMQNTIDSAVLAASSMTQDIDSETLIRDYVKKAGFDPDSVKIIPEDTKVNNGSLIGRTVTAYADVEVNTIFMDMLGINQLKGLTGSKAAEGVQNIEISLILDISGSMSKNNRLTNVKVAAKQFVDDMLDPMRDAGTTTISLIPYNATVVVGEDLIKHLNASGETIDLSSDPKPYPGMLDSYRTVQTSSTCVRFEDADFTTPGISDIQFLDRVGHFMRGGNGLKAPGMNQRWCNENRSSIVVHSNDAAALKLAIDGMTADGWTGIDNGMKWGTALLDPTISPVVAKMVDEGDAPGIALGRPGQYNPAETQKIIVLMTDGANTYQRDLRDPYKDGPSRVWYVPDAGDTANKWNGEYFVLMPDASDPNKRFARIGTTSNTAIAPSDRWLAAADLPADAGQLDYHALHERFAVQDIATFFFKDIDTDAYNAHWVGEYKTIEDTDIDTRLQQICDAAKAGGNITVYTIGFEAPAAGQTQMDLCSSGTGYYHPTSGTGISAVFASIAADIKKLRLTN